METWEPMLSRTLERQIFFGKRNRVALSTQQTIFLVPSRGGRGNKEKKVRKKGKLNPHVLSLLKGTDSKTATQFWLPVGLFPASPGLTEQGFPTGENSISRFIKCFI